MKNNQHTPTPWRVTKGTNGFCPTWQVEHVSQFRAATIADCGAVVNQVFQGSTEHYVGERVNYEHEANAHLIAAAPELLEACMAGLSLLKAAHIGKPGSVGFKQVQDMEAAIAKATPTTADAVKG